MGERMSEVGLGLHPDKTRVVYCKDGTRRGDHEHTSFTFLGFTFRARKARKRCGSRLRITKLAIELPADMRKAAPKPVR